MKKINGKVFFIFFILFFGILLGSAFAQQPVSDQPAEYRAFPYIGSRQAMWIAAQLHLMFAAFILGVPIFAVIVEFIGAYARDPIQRLRYDKLAREFTKLLLIAFSATAIWGAILTFLFITLYPKFFSYLANIFSPTLWIYPFLFFGETFTLYLYWYGWDWLQGKKKKYHLALGVLLNLFGIAVLFITDAWTTFMMSPSGVDEKGNLVSLWKAINNPLWMPLNIHRLIANIVFGGSIAAAYAAFRFLSSKTEEERAHYDWMGYIGNFIAIQAFIVLPFAGYWFGREIYAFDQQLGITMMGGFLSWLWIIQAILIGIIFLSSNYYLWIGMERIPGAERYRPYTRLILLVLIVGTLVWATPHSLVASLEEARKMGGAHHPLLGVLGVMSAKNTAVNIMILSTFLSFLFYRRGNKISRVSWARTGVIVQGLILFIAAFIVVFYGVRGYFVEAIVRIGYSVYQVLAVLSAIILTMILDIFMLRNAEEIGPIRWGKMPPRSQYALFLVAITFTWLMGLMGYARSAIRQHWHVYGVLRDTSPEAFSPTLGFAADMVSICVLLFFALVFFIFWIGHLGEKTKVLEERVEEEVKGVEGISTAKLKGGYTS
jgi:cytochrome bd-type quinol oxidase subunit 1